MKADEDMEEIWYLDDSELEEIWISAQDESKAHPTPFVAERAVREMLARQRMKLQTLIEKKQHTEEDLEENMISWLPRWKQWGLSIQIEELESEVEAAEHLHRLLTDDDELVSHIMAVLGADEGVMGSGALSKERFLEAVKGGEVMDVELGELEEEVDSEVPKP